MHTLPAIDARTLRQAFGCFPTGVTIVSTRGPDGVFVGLTVSSFTSLSLDPPLILWALSSRSSSLRAFETSERFAVNILADDQVAISQRFASSSRDKFHGIETHPGLGGTPLIQGCSAYIECSFHSAQPGGDHVIFIGTVQRVQVSARPPLVYVGARYRTVGPEPD